MKLTRPGLYYLLLVFVITVSATNTKSNLLHMFNAFLIALLLISWGLAKSNIRKVSLRLESPPEIFCKEPFTLRYLISNHSHYPKSALHFEDTISDRTFDLLQAPAQNTVGVNCETQLMARGAYKWKHLHVSSEFPFGFLRREIKMPIEHEILVLPRPLSYTSIPLPTKASMFREGNFTAVTRTASQDFATLRDYQPGDHLKSIHWKASAKSDDLVVKEYEEDLPAGVSIVMDIWPDECQEPCAWFENAIAITASLVWEISHAGYLILFAQGKQLVTYGRGRAHALRILRALAHADWQKDGGERSAVDRALTEIPSSSTAIFVFYQLREEIVAYLGRLSKQGCQVIGIVMDTQAVACPARIDLYRFQEYRDENIVLARV